MKSKLVIFNGSPRNKKSNSKILIDHFLEGYNELQKDFVGVHYLAETNKKEVLKGAFLNADTIIIIFPLYTDSMPGIVKQFFEDIINLQILKPKRIGFIVQSGFPEAIHSVYVERYLRKLTYRLNCIYLGTVIKGGVEGVQVMPSFISKKLYNKFRQLGRHFATSWEFNAEIVEQLKRPFKLPAQRRFIFKTLSLTGVTDFYWNMNLKKNNVYQKRFDKPYIV